MTEARDETWSIALDYSKKIGEFPSMFGQTIRLIMHDQMKHKALSPTTKFQVARVLKTGPFTAMMYYTTAFLHPDYLEKKKSLSVGQLMGRYAPFDLAAFMAALIVHRRTRKLLTETQWKTMSKNVTVESQMGAIVGVAFPTVGFGPGVLIGSLKRLVLAMMGKNDSKTYTEFLKKQAESTKWDHNLEVATWGCSSAQVASLVLTALGFPSDVSRGLAAGVMSKHGPADNAQVPKAFYLANMWLEAFAANLAQPEPKPLAVYMPEAKDYQRALGLLPTAMTQRSWIDRGKEDLSKEKTPLLFAVPEVNPEYEVPRELADIFTIEELTSMEEEDFDILLDHLESEQKSEKVAEKRELEATVE